MGLDSLQLSLQFLFGPRFPGNPPGEHFKEGDSDGPNVALVAVPILCQCLVGHVVGRTNTIGCGPILAFPCINSKAKVPNHHLFRCGEENVGRLDVPVDEVVEVDGAIAIYYLQQYSNGPRLVDPPLLPDQLPQGALLTKRSYDVYAVLGLDGVGEREDVGAVLEHPEGVYLRGGEVGGVEGVVVQFGDYLDGDHLFWVGGGVLVSWLVPL